MTKQPLPLPRCILYVRTTSERKASEIIERFTGQPPYKNKNCEYNVGCSDPEEESDLQYSFVVNGKYSQDDWAEVFMFFKIAGEFAQHCPDTEIGFQVFGESGTSKLWVSDIWKKRMLDFHASKESIEKSILDKFKRIQEILGEES